MAPPAVNFLSKILQADMSLCLLPKAPYLAMNIINHFLSACVVSPANLQSVDIRWVFLGSWCHCKASPSTEPKTVHFNHLCHFLISFTSTLLACLGTGSLVFKQLIPC